MENKTTIFKWAILTSGWGRSAQMCMELFKSGKLENHTINAVVTIGQDTPLLKLAQEAQIKTIEMAPKEFSDFTTYQSWLANELKKLEIDFLFMLNYKYKIRPVLLDTFPNRIFNIHPSLLPAFKNTKSAIQDAMNYGVKISGITTHIIDEKMDEGIIVCQKAIVFNDYDDFNSLDDKFQVCGRDIVLETFKWVETKYSIDISKK